jgi:hypothetical protein
LTWLAMTIIQTRNTDPMIQKAKTACQHWPVYSQSHSLGRNSRRSPLYEDIRTDIPLLQKRQRVRIRPRYIIAEHIRIALIINVWPCEELDRGANNAGDEKHEQDEREQHHSSGEQLALRDEGDFDDDEDYGERADG